MIQVFDDMEPASDCAFIPKRQRSYDVFTARSWRQLWIKYKGAFNHDLSEMAVA